MLCTTAAQSVSKNMICASVRIRGVSGGESFSIKKNRRDGNKNRERAYRVLKINARLADAIRPAILSAVSDELEPSMQSDRFSKWAPFALLVFALIYFGTYTRYWFSLTDEGGTAGVIAMRILAGERPLRDIFLGYNVLWFYP